MNTSNPNKGGSVFRYLKNKYVIGAIIIIVILVIWALSPGGSTTKLEVASVARQDVIEKVSVTGKISAVSRADLAFEKGGAISHIYKQVGDHVVHGELIASLANADDVASLASAQAKLDDIARSLRPEELQLEKDRVETARIALQNSKANAVNASRDAYAKVQGAIANYADVFFTNPQSANPSINVAVESNSIKISINDSRIAVAQVLTQWKDELSAVDASTNQNQLLASANSHLNAIKSFMDSLSFIVNRLSPGNSGLSQNIIDSLVSDMNLALTGFNQSISLVTGATTALNQAQSAYMEAQSNFSLKTAGSSNEAIRAQQANVAALQAMVNKGRIYSPIDGIVTKADPKEGEFVSAGVTSFAVMSDGLFKIEAYVPEADIAKVAVGNKAGVTLDAYGADTNFDATVTMIDPAETIIEGVPTYKVTLMFDQKDERIRSGMTANTDIFTRRRDQVLTVQTRAIIDVDGVKSVRIVNRDGKTFTTVPVKVGLKGSSGTTEIVSGVNEGDKVVTYTK